MSPTSKQTAQNMQCQGSVFLYLKFLLRPCRLWEVCMCVSEYLEAGARTYKSRVSPSETPWCGCCSNNILITRYEFICLFTWCVVWLQSLIWLPPDQSVSERISLLPIPALTPGRSAPAQMDWGASCDGSLSKCSALADLQPSQPRYLRSYYAV